MEAEKKQKAYSVFFSDPRADAKLNALKQQLGIPRGRILELIVLDANPAGIRLVHDEVGVDVATSG